MWSILTTIHHRILSHPEVSDEPEEEEQVPQALGSASSATPANTSTTTDTHEDEGKTSKN